MRSWPDVRPVYLLALACNVLLAVLPRRTANAQEIAREWVWKPIVEMDGVIVKYILYGKADGSRDGVVLLVRNTNTFTVAYRFSVVFRAAESEEVRRTEGELTPGQARTGDASGLFWIPFADNRPIVEIGLRGLAIAPKPGSQQGHARQH